MSNQNNCCNCDLCIRDRKFIKYLEEVYSDEAVDFFKEIYDQLNNLEFLMDGDERMKELEERYPEIL